MKKVDPLRHAERMAHKQKIMNERIARADKEQGVLLLLTGPGKGKSSSGFGMLARALGHGMKVGVVCCWPECLASSPTGWSAGSSSPAGYRRPG